MATDFVKRYFKKINTRVASVNKQDPFSMEFLNAISSGEQKLFQKHMLETRIFDGSWVDFIEDKLKHLDMVVRNPRTFIKDIDEIVPVERAKKTSPQSIRHLASHSYLVKEIKEDGEVVPNKILTTYKEEEYAIYENRFIKTLVDKVVAFVERRYATIQKLIGTDYINKFSNASTFSFDQLNIDYELNLKITKTINDSEAEKKNYELLERIKVLRAFILGFTKSDLMINLKNIKPVLPPIQKTNIIMRDQHYRRCYELWLFLDSYGKLDYTVQTSMAENQFLEEYVENIRELTLLSFATVVANDESNIGKYKVVPTIAPKKRKPKILSSLEDDESEDRRGAIELERQLINEYYYQEARKVYSRRIQDQVEMGEPFHIALKDIYKGAFKITETIFADLMTLPNDVKRDPMGQLRYRMRNQKALDEIYKYKLDDLKKMDRERIKNNKQIEREKAKIEERKVTKVKKLVEERTIEEIEEERKLIVKRLQQENAKILKNKTKEVNRIKKQLEKEIEKLRKQGEREIIRISMKKQNEIDRILNKQKREVEAEKQRLAREQQQEKQRIARDKEKIRRQEEKARELEKKRLEKERQEAQIERERKKRKKRTDELLKGMDDL